MVARRGEMVDQELNNIFHATMEIFIWTVHLVLGICDVPPVICFILSPFGYKLSITSGKVFGSNLHICFASRFFRTERGRVCWGSVRVNALYISVNSFDDK